MPSILILNQDPQGTHDGLGFPFEWSPVQSEGGPQLLQLLQLLQVDVFWGSESGASIWPWCHLEDYVRLALTTRYFAFDDMVVRQLAEISELVNSNDVIVLRELQSDYHALQGELWASEAIEAAMEAIIAASREAAIEAAIEAPREEEEEELS